MGMYVAGAANAFAVRSMYEAGASNVFPVSGMYVAGAANMFLVSSMYEAGARNVFRVSSMYEAGAQNVFFVACFPKGELVQLSPDKYAPIGSIKAGDRLYSWDSQQKKARYTAATKVHTYKVHEIVCLNNALRVASSHPLMVFEKDAHGLLYPIWKAAYDVAIGDILAGMDGRYIVVKSKSIHWYDNAIEVLNLSTDSGTPFLIGGCVVRAKNTEDKLKWADAPVTQHLFLDVS